MVGFILVICHRNHAKFLPGLFDGVLLPDLHGSETVWTFLFLLSSNPARLLLRIDILLLDVIPTAEHIPVYFVSIVRPVKQDAARRNGQKFCLVHRHGNPTIVLHHIVVLLPDRSAEIGLMITYRHKVQHHRFKEVFPLECDQTEGTNIGSFGRWVLCRNVIKAVQMEQPPCCLRKIQQPPFLSSSTKQPLLICALKQAPNHLSGRHHVPVGNCCALIKGMGFIKQPEPLPPSGKIRIKRGSRKFT